MCARKIQVCDDISSPPCNDERRYSICVELFDMDSYSTIDFCSCSCWDTQAGHFFHRAHILLSAVDKTDDKSARSY